jgi:fructose-1,6-bisphosphatase/inositol monophosphatase family enzyme
MSGLPLWGTLIGLTRNGKPCFGMMHQPFTGRALLRRRRAATYTDPGGTTRTLRTRRCATAGGGDPDRDEPAPVLGRRARRLRARGEAARLTRFGCDCYAYCMLAGRAISIS